MRLLPEAGHRPLTGRSFFGNGVIRPARIGVPGEVDQRVPISAIGQRAAATLLLVLLTNRGGLCLRILTWVHLALLSSRVLTGTHIEFACRIRSHTDFTDAEAARRSTATHTFYVQPRGA